MGDPAKYEDSNRSFQYLEESILKELYTRLGRETEGSEQGQDVFVPIRSTFDQVIQICLEASCLTEERQQTQLKLIVGGEVPGVTPFGHGTLSSDEFEGSHPLASKTLAKVAPAVSSSNSFLAVADWHKDDDGNGYLGLWGVVHGAHDAGLKPDAQAVSWGVKAPYFCIEIHGPMVIELFCGQKSFAKIARSTVTYSQHQLSDIPPIRKLYEEHAASLCSGETANHDSGIGVDQARELVASSYEQLFKRVKRQSHGALLLFLPKGIDADDLFREGRLAPKYRVQGDTLAHKRNSLARHLELMFTNIQSLTRLAKAERGKPEGHDRPILNSIMLQKNGLTVMYRERDKLLEAVAQYSNVDGAIVFSDKLILEAFGPEVLVSKDDTLELREVLSNKTEETRDSKHFGMRHRSTFRFCREVPSSVALVISEDGDAKVVTSEDGVVKMWTGVGV